MTRVFKLADDVSPFWDPHWRSVLTQELLSPPAKELRRRTHQTIRKATEDIDKFAFNTYVAALMTFLNHFHDFLRAVGQSPSGSEKAVASEGLESLLMLVAPTAPHSADEIWESLGMLGFTYNHPWPSYDEALCREDTVVIAVQVNGKLRDTIALPADAGEEELELAAKASSKVQTHLAGKTIRMVIVVPGKIVNFEAG